VIQKRKKKEYYFVDVVITDISRILGWSGETVKTCEKEKGEEKCDLHTERGVKPVAPPKRRRFAHPCFPYNNWPGVVLQFRFRDEPSRRNGIR